MELTDPFENQFTTVGKAPKLESIYGIALYDPRDGKIIHMRRILNMKGASRVNPQEKEVLEFAKKHLEYDVTKLSAIHNPNIQEISGKYYVNVKKN